MDHSPILEPLMGLVTGGAGWWIFATAVRTMPRPEPLERWYGWLYGFAQAVAANHDLREKEKAKAASAGE